MRNRIFLLSLATVAVAVALPALSLGQAGPPPADPAAAVPPGMQVLTGGPVHEAFAQPVSYQPEPTPAVPQAPPDPLPEEPPDQRPEGANVEWIGGYWAWDADRNEFIWVSGTYRNVPPGQRWVPGYWDNSPDGWRWVPGFWAPDAQAEVPYLPQPPAPLNLDPSTPPPDDNSFWTPGCWIYQQTRYVWRPGFWQAFRPGLLWQPPSYCWTPSGYAFVDGFWDYPLDGRGLLFAPVCFTQPLWQTPGWFYQPNYAVGYGPLLNSFFVRPGWGSYYFGNYYGPGYARRGFQPWFAYGPRAYDPLFSYYRWANRGNPGWLPGLRQTYQARLAGRAPLPPRTLAQQNLLLRQSVVNNSSLRMVSTLNQFRASNVRLTRVSAPQRTVYRTNVQQLRTLAVNRSRTETGLRAPRGGFAGGRPAGALRLPAAGGGARGLYSPRYPQAARPVRPQGGPQAFARPPVTQPRGPKALPGYRPTQPIRAGSRPAQPGTFANNLRPGGAPAWSGSRGPQSLTTPQSPRGPAYRAGGSASRPSALTLRRPDFQPRTPGLSPRSNPVPRSVGPAAQPRPAATRFAPQANPGRTAPAFRQTPARPSRPAAGPSRQAASPPRPAYQPRSFTASRPNAPAARAASRAASWRPPASASRPVQAPRYQAPAARPRPAVSHPAPAQGGRTAANNSRNRNHR